MKSKFNFDDEELEILEALHNDKVISSKTADDDIKRAKEAALNTLNKYEEVRIKLPLKDVQRLKTKALQSGISYQDLISALIHKYVDKLNVVVLTD